MNIKKELKLLQKQVSVVTKKEILSKEVKTIEVGRKSISELLTEMANTGFQGKKLGEVLKIWEEMLRQKDLTIFLGLAGSMSTTGQWKIIRWLIEKRYIDVLVSTGANISEDILEAMGYHYYQGTYLADDSLLLKYKIDRFYDIYADEYEYRKLEKKIYEFATTLSEEKVYSTREFLYLFGKYLDDQGISSIITEAYRKNVPVYSPALVDSGYGVALSLLKRDGKQVKIDQTSDIEELAKITESSKRTAVIYVGGGVPKDTIQLSTIIKSLWKGGDEETPHEYAIQITTDSPQWGGLSGCTLEEAISWGKIASNAKKATLYCDATIALPLITHALYELGIERKHKPDLSWVFKS